MNETFCNVKKLFFNEIINIYDFKELINWKLKIVVL